MLLQSIMSNMYERLDRQKMLVVSKNGHFSICPQYYWQQEVWISNPCLIYIIDFCLSTISFNLMQLLKAHQNCWIFNPLSPNPWLSPSWKGSGLFLSFFRSNIDRVKTFIDHPIMMIIILEYLTITHHYNFQLEDIDYRHYLGQHVQYQTNLRRRQNQPRITHYATHLVPKLSRALHADSKRVTERVRSTRDYSFFFSCFY